MRRQRQTAEQRRRRIALGAVCGVGLTLTLAVFGGRADAAFPGASGNIAFVSNREGGNHDLYTMNPDGTGRVNLTRHPADYRSPRWSADGSTIVFSSDRAGDGLQIYTMKADGSTNVNKLTSGSGPNVQPSWTSSGQILFTRGFFPSRSLYVMNADGSGQRKLTQGPLDSAWGAPAPRGPLVAFSRYGEAQGQRLYTLNTITGVTKLVTPAGPEAADAQANWSPSGNDIVFARFGETQADVFVVHKDGTGLRQLTDTPGRNESAPAFSPAGSKVVFAACSDPGALSQHCTLYTINTDGSSETEISTPTAPVVDTFDSGHRDPIWQQFGPDGSIAQEDGRLEITSPAGEVFAAHYGLNCSLRGDFEMEADYSLLAWPPTNGVSVRLEAFYANAGIGRQSDVSDSGREQYNAFSNSNYAFELPTLDQSGSLRLRRTGTTLEAYYRHPVGDWVRLLVDNSASTDDVVPGLSARRDTIKLDGGQVKVAFDNFRIGSGTLSCPSWWDDGAPDWQPRPNG